MTPAASWLLFGAIVCVVLAYTLLVHKLTLPYTRTSVDAPRLREKPENSVARPEEDAGQYGVRCRGAERTCPERRSRVRTGRLSLTSPTRGHL